MMKRWIMMAAAVLGLVGCGAKEAELVDAAAVENAPSGVAVMMVNGQPVLENEYAFMLRRFAHKVPNPDRVRRHRLTLDTIEYVLLRHVWTQDFVAKGSPVTEADIQTAQNKYISLLPRHQTLEDTLARENMSLEEFRMNTALNVYRERVIEELMGHLAPTTDAEAEQFYKDTPAIFDIPASVDARQIVVSSDSVGRESKEERVAAALQRLKDGERFAEVAWLYSDHPSRTEEGRLGRIWPGMIGNKRFDAVIFALEAGTWSDAIKEGENYYIFMVDTVYPHRIYEQDEVLEDVKRLLDLQKRQKALREFQLQMLRDADIQFVGTLKPLEEAYWRMFYPEIADEKLGVEPPEPTAEAEAS